jgi:hypothetical protein
MKHTSQNRGQNQTETRKPRTANQLKPDFYRVLSRTEMNTRTNLIYSCMCQKHIGYVSINNRVLKSKICVWNILDKEENKCELEI